MGEQAGLLSGEREHPGARRPFRWGDRRRDRAREHCRRRRARRYGQGLAGGCALSGPDERRNIGIPSPRRPTGNGPTRPRRTSGRASPA